MESPRAAANRAADRVLIVRNPHAGPGFGDPLVRELVRALHQHEMLAEIVTDPGALGSLAGELHSSGRLRAVVAAGGDGTVAEVVNRTSPGVPLSVFPLGTANLLASYLGIKRDPLALAETLRAGTLVRLDAARANGRIFVIMAGCGFDAEVVHRLHNRRRGKKISYWSYAGPILESIRRYRFPHLRVYCDGRAEAMEIARWAFVVNLPVYAAGLNVAPQAVGTDGKLNVCTFAGGSFWRGLSYVGNVALGRHQKLRDFKAAEVSRVRIESDEPVPYQLDGDPSGMLPLEIEVLPARLTLLAPQAQVKSLGLEASAAAAGA